MSSSISLFGMQINPLRMHDVIGQLLEWIKKPDGTCRYVVTPNVDHAVMFQEHEGLQRAYADAALVLTDGFPVFVAARMLRRQIPERVPGSDLVPTLFATVNSPGATGSASAADNGQLAPGSTGRASGTQTEICQSESLRVFLLGAAPGVADQAARNIAQRWPAVKIVGTYSPPLGFEKDPAENAAIIKRVNAAQFDVLVLGLGAPKQELWIQSHRHEITAPVALCVGATIDFLAGQKARAPVWMRRVGLEWLHRLASEPKRLAKRYLRDAWVFPALIWREARLRNGGTG
jgi:N-acetylglucosaminyldiphosphoundecaprenol N-acetyl-beta-D-mannosaminyltransferase